MPLFSPSLHGIAGVVTVSSPDGGLDQIAFHDASLGRAVRATLAKLAQDECFVFSLIGLTNNSPLVVSNFTVSTTTARLQMRWPFNWTCTGIRQSVSGRPASGTAAGINILRNGNSIFDNSTTIGTSNATVATGAGNMYSSKVSPHASHVSWSKGDNIQIYQTAGAAGSGNAANNFHAPVVYLYGNRR